KGWHAGAGRRGFWRDQRRPALGSGEALPRRAARWHSCDQEQEAGFRRGQKTLEAEGYRSRPCGIDPFATVAAWRDGPRTATALACIHFPAQEATGRFALGIGRKIERRQADRGECV